MIKMQLKLTEKNHRLQPVESVCDDDGGLGIAMTEAVEGQAAYTGSQLLEVVAEAAAALVAVKKLLIVVGLIVVPGIVVRLFVVPLTVVPLMTVERSVLPLPLEEEPLIVLGLSVVPAAGV